MSDDSEGIMSKLRKWDRNLSRLTAVALLAPLASAHAAEDSTSGGLEEVVVTAQKRAENLQDVPMSISVLSGEALANKQILSLRELVVGTPNVQASGVFAEGMPVFSVRGITSVAYGPTDASPVATYYDEVYKGSVTLLGVGMYDLDRVEVLKGPQGTLYGRSTTGGAVNLVSRLPQFERSGNASLSYGRFNRITADGAGEVALSDTLGVRAAFTYDRDDGAMKNRFPGGADGQQTQQWGGRVTLRYKPSDATDIVLRYSHSDENFNPTGVVAIPSNPTDSYGLGRANLGRREFNTPDQFKNTQKSDAFAVNATFQLADGLALTSISSWDRGEVFLPSDVDGLPQKDYLAFQGTTQTVVAQDLRLASSYDTPFNFIVGAYYGRDTSNVYGSIGLFQDVDVNGDGVITPSDCVDSGFALCTINGEFKQVKTSAAGYADLKYKLGDAWTLRGGLRYTRDRGEMSNYIVTIGTVSTPANPRGTPLLNAITFGGGDDRTSLDSKFRHGRVSYKLGLDYETEGGNLLYLSYNVGWRAASFNNVSFAMTPETIAASKPEKLASTELGFKSELLDHRVRLNGAAFWYQFTDQQVYNAIQAGATQLDNLPKSRVLGAELEVQASVSDALVLSAALGLLDTKVTEGSLFGFSVVGNELVQAPRYTFSVAADYAMELGAWGAADLHADYFQSAKQYWDSANTPAVAEGGYGLLNARVRFHRGEDSKYGFSIWGKNLTDEYYHTFRAPGQGFIISFINPPRTYGVSFDVKF